MCLIIVSPLQGDIRFRPPGLEYRKWNITSQRLKGSWNATSADTCAPREVSHFEGSLTNYLPLLVVLDGVRDDGTKIQADFPFGFLVFSFSYLREVHTF